MYSGVILLWRMEELGFKVDLNKGELVIQPPPRKRIPKALQERIDQHKSELIAAIGQRGLKSEQDKIEEAVRRFKLKPCPSCRRTGYWVSMHGSVACFNCHPPGDRFMARKFLGPDTPK